MSRLPECRYRGRRRHFLKYGVDDPEIELQPRNRGLLCLHPRCTEVFNGGIALHIRIERCRYCLDNEGCPEGWR